MAETWTKKPRTGEPKHFAYLTVGAIKYPMPEALVDQIIADHNAARVLADAVALLRELFTEGSGFFDGEMGYCLGGCTHEGILNQGWHTTFGKGGRKYRRYNDKHDDNCVNIVLEFGNAENWHDKDCIYARVYAFFAAQPEHEHKT